jgi:outer membrane immunogenic protein
MFWFGFWGFFIMRLTKKKVGCGIAAVAMIGALVGAPVLAANVPVKAPPPRPKAIYSWAGFYLGLNAGGVCSRLAAERGAFSPSGAVGFVDFVDRIALDGEFPGFLGPKCGFIGGGQIGYNWQSTNWVWGVEHDIQGTTLRASDTRSFSGAGVFAPSTEQASANLRALGTFRARAGVLATPSFLIYATGGLAYGAVKNTFSTTTVPGGFPGVTVSGEDSDIVWGWTAGAGAEWVVNGPWTAKAEYLYYSLHDTVNLNFGVLPGGAGTFINYKFKNDGHIFRLGLNYKLGQSAGP